MTAVVDASVMLAIIFGEPGADQALIAIRGGSMSSVNLSEVLSKCLERGADPDFAERQIRRLNISIAAFTAQDAKAAAALRLATRSHGLSFGDRACLALALRENAHVLTADRHWDGVDIGLDIRLIR